MTSARVYDAIVIGVGGMGSATVYQLAKRGLRVLGLERFRIPHELGSSHGITRIIRLAFHEGPEYVPLGRRAYELWNELEERSGEQVLHITGSVHAGAPGAAAFESTLRACVEQDVPHEVLTSMELSARFPGYGLPPEMSAVVQPQGGFLTPEPCVEGHVTVARDLGAEVREEEQVLDWEAFSGSVRVRTEAGVYEAGPLVLTAGAWAGRLAPELAEVAVPERQVMAWFEPDDPAVFAPSRFPVFIVTMDGDEYYGFHSSARRGSSWASSTTPGRQLTPTRSTGRGAPTTRRCCVNSCAGASRRRQGVCCGWRSVCSPTHRTGTSS